MIDQYKAIIFDWDGTLVDTCGLILDAHNHVRVHMGHEPWTMDDFLGRASKSAREYYPEVYGERANEAQTVLYDYVEEHHLTYLQPMAVACDLLNHISKMNIPMGIVSNKRHATLHTEVKAMEWQSYFKVVIGAGKATRDKPSPDPLLMAMKEMDDALTTNDILYVGDTETDLLCAQNTGVPIAFIQSDKPRPDLVRKYNPVFECHDLSTFLNSLQSAEQKTA